MYFKYNDELYSFADVIHVSCKFNKLTLLTYMYDDCVNITGVDTQKLFEAIVKQLKEKVSLIDIDELIEQLEE